MKEEEKIEIKGNRSVLAGYQLSVAEHQDAGKPQRTAERQKHPKSITPAVGRSGIPKQCGVGKKRSQTREEIAQSCLR
jgi:hypothetical protein